MLEIEQFTSLSLVSSFFCLMTLLLSPYRNTDFSPSLMSFTCFLGTAMLSFTITFFNSIWKQKGIDDASRNSKIVPIGWFAIGLFFFGLFFLFVSYALVQTAISTLVICSLLFFGILCGSVYLAVV